MVGVEGWGVGQGPGMTGLWTGEVLLQWVFPRGTHDLWKRQKKSIQKHLLAKCRQSISWVVFEVFIILQDEYCVSNSLLHKRTVKPSSILHKHQQLTEDKSQGHECHGKGRENDWPWISVCVCINHPGHLTK